MTLLRALLNGWLVAVALDGAVRLLAGLVHALTGSQALAMLVMPFELVALFGCVLGWGAALASSKIPKRMMLPPLITMTWLVAGALPIPVLWYNQPGFQISLGLVLMGSVGLTELLGRTAGHGKWLLQREPLGDDLGFTFKRAIGWTAGWAILAPAALAIYTVVGVSWTVSYGTAGFLTMTGTGIAASHKTYVKDDDTIDLIAMIHLGEQDGYDELFSRIVPDGRTIILSEGVADSEHLLTAPGDAYAKAASKIGLSAQAPMEKLTDLPVQNADVDVNTFDPVTIELLNVVLALYGSIDNPSKGLIDYLGFWQGHRSDSQDVIDQLFEDILSSRNTHLLAEIEAALEAQDRLVVPWGALHMVEVSQALEEQGWDHTETHKITLIRWSTLFDAVL